MIRGLGRGAGLVDQCLDLLVSLSSHVIIALTVLPVSR